MPENRDFIELEARGLPAIMGYARHERVEPQGIHVHVALEFDAQVAARSGELSDAIDYVRVLGEYRFLLWASRFFLIETAAETLCRYTLSPQWDGRPAQALGVRLRLEKPSALGAHATPALNVYRQRGLYTFAPFEGENFQEIDDNRDCRVSRIVLPPGGAFAPSRSRVAVMALGDEVYWGDERVPAGGAHYSAIPNSLEWVNRGLEPVALLCVECHDEAWSEKHLEHYPAAQGAGFSFYDSVLGEYVKRH
ncbi:MAG: dihydroneopterin aldolase [Bdellovibrionaceae bacterium]|nr:dihydroneopterin aldolase [Pseudobdellovibrionaceae bacterium]